MVREIHNELYIVNTYASRTIIEVDYDCSAEAQDIRKNLELKSQGCRLNLFMWLAEKTVDGYAIVSVTEFNPDGSKPRVAYKNDTDFKKLLKCFSVKKIRNKGQI